MFLAGNKIFVIFIRKVTTSIPSTSVISTPIQQPVTPPVVTQTTTITDSDNPDWTFDPNEPRYCICNQVSYGDMVACDNSDVSFNNKIHKIKQFTFFQSIKGEINNFKNNLKMNDSNVYEKIKKKKKQSLLQETGACKLETRSLQQRVP